MRVLHAANYSLRRDGTEFFNCEFKFHTGLCQAGHYVYPFSINDRARDNLFGTSRLGKAKANRALIAACANIAPDLVLLGHAPAITPETLAMLRRQHPAAAFALWYVDAVYFQDRFDQLCAKLPYLDALFVTTAGEPLERFRAYCRDRSLACRPAFIPNPVDSGVERLAVDESATPPRHDLVFIGTDYQRPERRAFLDALAAKADGLRLAFAGCRDNPPVFGHERDLLLAASLTALNLSDRNDVPLYSSDRIAQLTGNGLCTFTPASTGLQTLFVPDREMVFFDTVDDLVARLRHFAAHPDAARAIGRAGRLKAHERYSGKAIAEFMCDWIFAPKRAREWV